MAIFGPKRPKYGHNWVVLAISGPGSPKLADPGGSTLALGGIHPGWWVWVVWAVRKCHSGALERPETAQIWPKLGSFGHKRPWSLILIILMILMIFIFLVIQSKMSYLISLHPVLLKNIAHVRSICIFDLYCICVFVFLFLHVRHLGTKSSHYYLSRIYPMIGCHKNIR